MKSDSLEQAIEVINSAEKIVVTAHVSPDGDALGSTLALTAALKKIGKDVCTLFDDKINSVYKFLPELELIKFASEKDFYEVDLLIILDSSDLDRIGKVKDCVKATKTLNIDHHLSNEGIFDYVVLDTKAAATGEIIVSLLEKMSIAIDESMATQLYTALMTDCGSFRYANTTPETLECAAKLMRAGAKPNIIADNLEIRSKDSIEMLFNVLKSLEFFHDSRMATITIDKTLYKEGMDTDGYISYPRYIDGVDVAVLFKEVGENVTRVSMRSKELDVSSIASKFGGGGHLRAAGCTIYKPVGEAKQLITDSVKEIL